MRFIKKDRDTPAQLLTEATRYNSSLVDGIYHPTFSYDDDLTTPQKDLLRRVLVAEQLGLCAYCQGPISSSSKTTKIEHLVCRTHSRHYSLAYSNLLAVCNNGSGHCDERRSKTNIYLTPIWFFDNCKTTAWDHLNPYFEVETNNSRQPNGKLCAAVGRLIGIAEAKITELITELDLNNASLVANRKNELNQKIKRIRNGHHTARDLFNALIQQQFELRQGGINRRPTPYPEFLLLALRKLGELTP